MNISVIGTGYVGLVAGTCLAGMGNNIICVDNNTQKIKELQQGKVPIYEPGLEELIKVNITENRLSFTDNMDKAVKNSLICIIAVGTPQSSDGSCDLSAVYKVAESIAESMNGYKVIVNKSTVPIGTASKVKEIISDLTEHDFDVVSNPEFLKQGAAVDDFLKPDRVIIGVESQKAAEIMQEVYCPFLRTGNPIIVMDIKSAEMSKYAANSFLAVKISFINEISAICENLGADIEQVRIGMSTDRRIGNQFLFPGLGYGGSCFPKDVKALIKIAQENGYDSKILCSADHVNKVQRQIFINKILGYCNSDIRGKTFAIWGLSFKPRTNDVREAPSITIINKLLGLGVNIRAFDPKGVEAFKKLVPDESIVYTKSNYEALENADALLLITEWNEFRRPNFDRIKKLLKHPVIFDGRNQYEPKRMEQRGFDYISIGKKDILGSRANSSFV